jgi:hypothetical protein
MYAGSTSFQEKQGALVELHDSLKKQADQLLETSETLRYGTQKECQDVLQEQTNTRQKINAEKQQMQNEIRQAQCEVEALENAGSSSEISEELQLEGEVGARTQEQKQRKELQVLNEAEAFYSHMSQTVSATAGYTVDRFTEDGLVLKIRMIDLDQRSVTDRPLQKRMKPNDDVDSAEKNEDLEDNNGVSNKVTEKALQGVDSTTESSGAGAPWIKTSDEYELKISFKPNSSAVAGVELSPSDAAPIGDIVEAAMCRACEDEGEQLRFLLREVRGRLRNHSVLAQHLLELRNIYHTSFGCLNGGDGMSGGMTEATFALPVGVTVSVEISPDYPQAYAPVHLTRFDGVDGWSKVELETLRKDLNDGETQMRLHLPSLAREVHARLTREHKSSTPKQTLKGRIQLETGSQASINHKRARDGSPKQ